MFSSKNLPIMPALCSKLAYYAGIMLDALACLLCLKLCRHNRRMPKVEYIFICFAWTDHRDTTAMYPWKVMHSIGASIILRIIVNFGENNSRINFHEHNYMMFMKNING